MKMSQNLLRGAAIAAVGLAVFGTTVTITTPTAEASVLEKKNGKSEKSGISDVPIIGDLVGSFEGQEPEDIAVGAIQLGAGAAEVVVPIVIRAFK
jgi:hypothetical protein